ncbi:MAG: cohesin domain-containing protein [Syntrophomonas sp.]
MILKNNKILIPALSVLFFIMALFCYVSPAAAVGEELPLLSIDQGALVEGYPPTSITLTDSTAEQNLWISGAAMKIEIFADTTESTGTALVTIPDIIASEDAVTFDLPNELPAGPYVIMVSPQSETVVSPIGQAFLIINPPVSSGGGGGVTVLTATPASIPADYSTDTIITLQKPDPALWSTTDSLQVEILATDPVTSMPIEPVLYTLTPAFDTSENLSITVPQGLQPGFYALHVTNGTDSIAVAGLTIETAAVPSVASPQAWLATSSVQARTDNNEYLELTVNAENVTFTEATFQIDYPADVVYDPSYYDPMRSDLTSRSEILYEDLGNGLRRATINLAGNVTIGDTSNITPGDMTTYPTLFELQFTPKAEGTVPLALFNPTSYMSGYTSCSLTAVNGQDPVEFASKPYNDEIILFTCTNKQDVFYVYDMGTGQPLTNGTIYAVTDTTREAMTCTPDSYGGYFFDLVTGAVNYELEIPGYDILNPANGEYIHVVSGIMPCFFGAYPECIKPTAEDIQITIKQPGIGNLFATGNFSAVLYSSNYSELNGMILTPLTKTITFQAGKDEDSIVMTIVGGLEQPSDPEPQMYDIYIYNNSSLIGRTFAMVDKNFTPWIDAEPDLLKNNYPTDQIITLYEDGVNAWTAADLLEVKIFTMDYTASEPVKTYLAVIDSTNLTVTEDSISFTLPTGLLRGSYDLEVLKDTQVIAQSYFQIESPQANMTPNNISAGYSDPIGITIWDETPNATMWDADEDLALNIYKYDEAYGDWILDSHVFSDWWVYDDKIDAPLPVGLSVGKYKIGIQRGSEEIACARFTICLLLNPRELPLGNSEPINMTLAVPDGTDSIWTASDTLTFELLKFNYETKDYDNTGIVPGSINILDRSIDFTIPPGFESGEYAIRVSRGDSEIAFELFWVRVPEIDVSPSEFIEGYAIPLDTTICVPENMSDIWTAADQLGLRLIKYSYEQNDWVEIESNLNISSMDNRTIHSQLPTGLTAGDYVLSLSRGIDEIAFGMFNILPPAPLTILTETLPAATVGQNYSALIDGDGGVGPYTWSWDPLVDDVPPGLALLPGTPGPDGTIQGMPTQAGIYIFQVKVMDSTNPSQIVTKYLTLQVNENNTSRVIVGKTNGLPGSTVTVPVFGNNVAGVNGAQFVIRYNPQVAVIPTDIDTSLPCITRYVNGIESTEGIVANVDNLNGEAYITISSVGDLTENYGCLCNITFNLLGTAGQTTDVTIEPIDNIVLSNGDTDIPCTLENGGISIVNCGDVNGNSRIDVGDAVLILKYDAGLITLPTERLAVANVDSDPAINVNDAISILKYIVRLINQLPVQL